MEEMKSELGLANNKKLILTVIYDKVADKYGSFQVFDTYVNAQRYYLQLFATVPNQTDYLLYTICLIDPETALCQPATNFDDNILKPRFVDITPTEDAIALYRKQLEAMRRRTNG